MGKRGPKPLEIDLDKVEEYAALGCTEEAIASLIGMKRTCWYENKAKSPDITDALRKGRSKGQQELLATLREMAKDKVPAALIFALKSQHQFRDNDSKLELTGPNGSALQVEHSMVTPHERALKLQELKLLEATDED